MRLLLDTHVLIWTFVDPRRLSLATRKLIEDSENDVIFSVISLWEIGVKRALKRSDFEVDPYVLRSRALAYGYQELCLAGSMCLLFMGFPRFTEIHTTDFSRVRL